MIPNPSRKLRPQAICTRLKARSATSEATPAFLINSATTDLQSLSSPLVAETMISTILGYIIVIYFKNFKLQANLLCISAIALF